MKTIVAGGRDFNNYELLKDTLDKYIITEVVSGACYGADKLGEKYAEEKNIPIKSYPADWDTYGKKAGFLRNHEMAKYGDVLIAFWNGRSLGTRHMIFLAKKCGVKTIIIEYNNENISN